VKPLSSSHVDSGSSFYLECAFSGLPQPRITWFRNGTLIPVNGSLSESNPKPLASGAVVVVARKAFSILNSDCTGVYECRAENVAGSSSTSATLSVRDEAKAGLLLIMITIHGILISLLHRHEMLEPLKFDLMIKLELDLLSAERSKTPKDAYDFLNST